MEEKLKQTNKNKVKIKVKNRPASENTYFNFQASKGSPCGVKRKKINISSTLGSNSCS